MGTRTRRCHRAANTGRARLESRLAGASGHDGPRSLNKFRFLRIAFSFEGVRPARTATARANHWRESRESLLGRSSTVTDDSAHEGFAGPGSGPSGCPSERLGLTGDRCI